MFSGLKITVEENAAPTRSMICRYIAVALIFGVALAVLIFVIWRVTCGMTADVMSHFRHHWFQLHTLHNGGSARVYSFIELIGSILTVEIRA